MDAFVPTQPGDVITGDEPTQAVPDDVDPLIAGLGDDRLDLLAEVERCPPEAKRAAGEKT